MINDKMKLILKEMAGMIKDLEREREEIETRFEDPDVCWDCNWFRSLGHGNSTKWCRNKQACMYNRSTPGMRTGELCCIHFEQREVGSCSEDGS